MRLSPTGGCVLELQQLERWTDGIWWAAEVAWPAAAIGSNDKLIQFYFASAIGCYWMLLDAIGCYWMLLGKWWQVVITCKKHMQIFNSAFVLHPYSWAPRHLLASATGACSSQHSWHGFSGREVAGTDGFSNRQVVLRWGAMVPMPLSCHLRYSCHSCLIIQTSPFGHPAYDGWALLESQFSRTMRCFIDLHDMAGIGPLSSLSHCFYLVFFRRRRRQASQSMQGNVGRMVSVHWPDFDLDFCS